jgi:hypothetical protein
MDGHPILKKHQIKFTMSNKFQPVKLSLISAALLLFISCSRQTGTVKEEALQPKEIILDANTKFLINGKEEMTYSKYNLLYPVNSLNESSTKDSSRCIVIGFNGANYIFTSEAQLRKWSKLTAGAEEYAKKLDTADQLQNYATIRGILDDSLATLQFTDSLIAATGPSLAPVPISGLYDFYDYNGSYYWWPVVSIRPTLGGFNGRGSSLTDYYFTPKLNMLTARTWFRGEKFFYWSWSLFRNLNSVGYDNKASSKL